MNEPQRRRRAGVAQVRGDGQEPGDACEPHRLCGYLYSLVTAFSSFFENCPALRASDEATRDGRLRLAALTGRVLEDGLTTLGLVPLERM
ncbi:MAG: DALR anticodon-binding domain-containing protein [Phycisphaerales bacterium]